MAFTRTHTYYFGEDDLAPLKEQVARLIKDAHERTPYIDQPMRQQLLDRVENLRLAVSLLGEQVD